MKNRVFHTIKLILSLSFILSGLVKGIDPYGTSLKIIEYVNQFGFEVAKDISMAFSVSLCGVEILTGLCLMLNTYLKQVLNVALFMLLMFTMVLVTVVVLPGMRIEECGCFGDLLPMSTTMSIIKNLLLIAMTVSLLFAVGLDYIQFSERISNKYVFFSIIVAFAIPVYSLVRLPFIEFSDYRKGADLKEVKSFQVMNGDCENVTDSLLSSENLILIIKKQEFNSKELGIIEQLKTNTSKMQYGVVTITDFTSENKDDVMYCSENTLKMIVRTPGNAIVHMDRGIVKNKHKL